MSRAAVKVGGGGSAVVGRVGPRERREGRRESGREEGREGERGEERIGESTHTRLLPALPPPDYVPINTPQGRHLRCSLCCSSPCLAGRLGADPAAARQAQEGARASTRRMPHHPPGPSLPGPVAAVST